MPDGILVYDNTGIGFVEYCDIEIKANTCQYIEAYPPHDAHVIKKTWLHPNKKGGADGRFKKNHEMSVCLYGELTLKSNSGMNLCMMTSKHDSPSNFELEFRNISIES